MKVILLGSNGQLGWEFKQFLQDKVKLFSFTHKDLDILDVNSLERNFQEMSPDIVINCAAYTKVDKAEEEQELAYNINAIGAKNVSFASFKVNAKVIYFSTDYVFDGRKNSPYTELDKPNPISAYGKSKLSGEVFTKESNPNYLILRISWLYGINGNNFIKTVIKLAKSDKPLRIVNNQYGTPTYTLDVVKQTWELIRNGKTGLYHSSNNGEATWFEFAKEIIPDLNLKVEAIPIRTEDYPTPAKRPRYSVLKNHLLKLEKLDIMRKWKKALKDFINNYKEQLLSE